jgi:hypothetical protein
MEFISVPKPQLKRNEELPAMPALDDYAPRKYSVRENAVMGLRIILVAGLLFGLLWLLEAMTAK